MFDHNRIFTPLNQLFAKSQTLKVLIYYLKVNIFTTFVISLQKFETKS